MNNYAEAIALELSTELSTSSLVSLPNLMTHTVSWYLEVDSYSEFMVRTSRSI